MRMPIAVSLLLVSSVAYAEPVPRPKVDVVFAIDTTGSMAGGIAAVKDRLRKMVAEIDSGEPIPSVRVGLVAYRDRGDAYITQTLPLTHDIDKVVLTLAKLQADGGGDEPEDVQEALRVALTQLDWDKSPETARLVFLVGDAGPHFYAGEPSLEKLGAMAVERGIQLDAIGCGGLAGKGEAAFQKLATAGGGRYGRFAGSSDGLDALVTDAVRDELARRGVRYVAGK